MEVVVVTEPEDRRKVFSLRYQIYSELGWTHAGLDHEQGLACDDRDDVAEIVLMRDEKTNQPIGTMRAYTAEKASPEYARHISLEKFAPLGFERVCILDRLAIKEQYRNAAAPGILYSHAFRLGLERDYKMAILDCQAHHVRMYEQMGYRQYRPGFYYGGYNIPVAFVLDDIDYLRAIRSPLQRMARGRPSTDRTTDWFLQTFPDRPPGLQSPLPETLQAEAPELAQRLAVIIASAGDEILAAPDRAPCLFWVGSGLLDVILAGRPLTTLQRGHTFGEVDGVAYGRSPGAAIRARTRCELLVFTSRDVAWLRRDFPGLAGQLFESDRLSCASGA